MRRVKPTLLATESAGAFQTRREITRKGNPGFAWANRSTGGATRIQASGTMVMVQSRKPPSDGVRDWTDGVESRTRPPTVSSKPAFAVQRLFLIVAALLAAAAPNAAGQGRSVRGRVTDQGGEPLRGAVVKIKNALTLQVRSYITQADGEYRFHGLHYDVDYKLNARYRGQASKTKMLNWHDSRRGANIDLKIRLAADARRSPTAFLTDTIEGGPDELSEGRISE